MQSGLSSEKIARKIEQLELLIEELEAPTPAQVQVAATVSPAAVRMRLGFQPKKAAGLDANYHFAFTGKETALATVVIRNQRLSVLNGHQGKADLQITADARCWIRFLNREISALRCLVTRAIRLRGPIRLFVAFRRCFPT